ncbi:TlpA family protein disulfide reductase [Propioniciclava tarda]|uniref:TlpA family protein disulfide reductase n=1 Tax=Propioniciclava tarda TaxID=433330 RepID=A0A4Q9KLH2_PROTD|nr:TlpA disulfide reductase family protein [Propioniciclava tarda]TBT94499.1 TlpA family protein disulfide reductase [Propioniciclava tarda]SMO69147.1 Peroxiredoxin [Propioniciclava tarda]HOC14375.1 TlpA disulfide reductase family protein [Propionicimonas sp.]
MSDHVDESFDEFLDDDVDEPARPVRLAPVDVLSDAPAGARERIRSSKLGTLVVLLITAAVVAGGVWLVNQGNAKNAAAQTAGGTVVKMPGISKVAPPEVGKPAQDFTITTYDGKSVSLSGLKGKAVWVTFGASWCSGCQAEVPDINAAAKAFESKGVVVLGVNISEDNAAVKAYAQRIGLMYPIGADPESAIADDYAVSAIPSHFFIDANGVVRDIRLGALSPSMMESILNKLVAS